MKHNKPSNAKQSGAIFTGKIMALIASFMMPFFLTRYLPKSDYGIYSQFSVVTAFCTSFFSMGIQSNLYYFYPTASTNKRKSLVSNTFILLILFSLVSISLIIIPGISRYIIGDESLLLYKGFIIIGIVLLMPLNIIEPLYVVRKDFITSVFYPPSEVVIRIVIIIGCALLFSGLNSIFLGVLITAFATLIFAIFYVSRDIGKLNSFRELVSLKIAKEQLHYAIPFGMAVGLNVIAQKFDKLVCISFLTPAAFATYSIAFYGIPGLQQLYSSISQVYLINMVTEHKNRNIKGISDIYKSLVTKTYSFTIPAIFIVALYAKKIVIFLFTANYSDSVPLFRIYLLSFFFIMLGSGLVLRAMDKTKFSFNAYLISSLITIPSTYFMIKYFNMWGALIGSLISIIFPKIFMIIKEMKLLNSNIINFYPWKKFAIIFLISLISIIPFLLIEFFLDYGIILVILFILVYLIIVSILEMKYNVFIFENQIVKSKINKLILKVRRM